MEKTKEILAKHIGVLKIDGIKWDRVSGASNKILEAMEEYAQYKVNELNKSDVKRSYFHEAPQKDIDKMVKEKKTWSDIKKKYKQPKWCNYPGALEGRMGCWSLVDIQKEGGRTKISHKFCSGCECYRK